MATSDVSPSVIDARPTAAPPRLPQHHHASSLYTCTPYIELELKRALSFRHTLRL